MKEFGHCNILEFCQIEHRNKANWKGGTNLTYPYNLSVLYIRDPAAGTFWNTHSVHDRVTNYFKSPQHHQYSLWQLRPTPATNKCNNAVEVQIHIGLQAICKNIQALILQRINTMQRFLHVGVYPRPQDKQRVFLWQRCFQFLKHIVAGLFKMPQGTSRKNNESKSQIHL